MQFQTRQEMYGYYFSDPKEQGFTKVINHVEVKYNYFTKPIAISTGDSEVCNFCLLKGASNLFRAEHKTLLNQFDLGFLPENEHVLIKPLVVDRWANKICIMTNPISGTPNRVSKSKFEIQRFSFDKFVPRGEFGDTQKITTYREVWTAFKNGYFMSGFTNIPQDALTQGVITSVNLEKEGQTIKILSHIHPDYPEIYIYCIDDPTNSVAVTQYLINTQGQSVAKDLTDGEGIFFDGSLGHLNFTKPTYKPVQYCLYMWIIPTFGKVQDVQPQSLNY